MLQNGFGGRFPGDNPYSNQEVRRQAPPALVNGILDVGETNGHYVNQIFLGDVAERCHSVPTTAAD